LTARAAKRARRPRRIARGRVPTIKIK
jgi:hypothetical protein